MKDAKPEQIVAFLTGHRDHFSPIGYGTPMTDIVERLRGHPGAGMSVTEQFRNMVEQRHEAAADIERLRSRLTEVDAQLTAEGRIHARECMALRAEKEAEIERLTEAVATCRELRVYDQRDNARLTAALQALADDDAVPPWIRTLARHALEPQP